VVEIAFLLIPENFYSAAAFKSPKDNTRGVLNAKNL
jgi:hypothetical protein